MERIRVVGAKTHNLKNITVEIPRNKLVVITGPSGSGKSSLAFDTIYAEGQRRYAESLPAYARLVLGTQAKPDVDSVEGLTPTLAISQLRSKAGARSTVGTISEINDYARLLFSRIGVAFCPTHGVKLQRHSIHDMVSFALRLKEETKVAILAPVASLFDRDTLKAAREMQRTGFVRLRVDGKFLTVEEVLGKRGENKAQTIDVVVDRLRIKEAARSRLAESFEAACNLSNGKAILFNLDSGAEENFSQHYGCPECGYTIPDLTPAMFSFNNALGACPRCEGRGFVEDFDCALLIKDAELSLREGAILGVSDKSYEAFAELLNLSRKMGFSVDTSFEELSQEVKDAIFYGKGDAAKAIGFEGVIPKLRRRWDRARSDTVKMGFSVLRSRSVCPECQGSRLRSDMQNVRLGNGKSSLNIVQFSSLSLTELQEKLKTLEFDSNARLIGSMALEEIDRRLGFLIDAGLGYLTLDRPVATLSGGELQRIRLAGQLGSGLSGVTYVLDEPTVGLHPRDTARLVRMLKRLVEAGNTVIAVEHDADFMKAADWIVDMGPGAGSEGGTVVASSAPGELKENKDSLTGAYLSGKKHVVTKKAHRAINPEKVLRIVRATGRNLKAISCQIPMGALTVVTGVSGSGKTTLILETLAAEMRRRLYRAKEKPQPFEALVGGDEFDKVLLVDQAAMGRAGRATLATYTGVASLIRDLFAETSLARERGYDAGRFSFNKVGGRCEACEGEGESTIEMGFLPPVRVRCPVCQGRRFNRETLDVRFKGKSIADVLEMTVSEALIFFAAQPAIERSLALMKEIGLGYLRLGQRADTLSGGEAQRVRLAEELSRKSTGKTLYILDEPTTGLHFEDVKFLLRALDRLVEEGNTVLVIEHNPDVIRAADWVIDLGPEGGKAGGNLIGEGTPEEIAANAESITGRFL